MIQQTMMRHPRRRATFIALFLCLSAVLPSYLLAATVFDGLDMGNDDKLLFRAGTGGDGSLLQSALFITKLGSGQIDQLTAFPERIELIENGRLLQVRNPFGAVRIPVSGGLPKSVGGFPSFASGAVVQAGRTENMAASPDGKWILYVEPTSPAYGRLVLVDSSTGYRAPVADNVERPGKVFPASWSPDSRVFVYARDRRLFFRAVDSANAPVIDERYRMVGEGAIASIRWGLAGDFYYLRGSTVYRVRGSDLFARSLYSDFLEIGTVAGKIPFEFDPNFDAFWNAPDGSAILLAKGGRNIFYFPLGVDDYGHEGAASLPYMMLPRSCSDLRVLWSQSGIITVFASFPAGLSRTSRAYRLEPPSEKANMVAWGFDELDIAPETTASLSPDGNRAVLFGPWGAEIYDYINWKSIYKLGARSTLSVLWLGNEELIVADTALIERRSLDGRRSLLCLSASESHGFGEDASLVYAKSAGDWYVSDGLKPWSVAAEKSQSRSAAVTISPKYRVYLERVPSGPYETMPMIRDVRGVGTVSLLIKPPPAWEPFPPQSNDDPDVTLTDRAFTNGKRQGRRELALTFDLIDDAEGLPFVLDTLKRFGVTSTFFLNGEFIRRHPTAAKEIVEAGHETASMFFAPIDLADARYRIDADFIRRGLARNEDEFFNATGSELSLLWHAPWYAVSPTLVAAGASVSYRYISRDVNPLDWVTRLDARRNPSLYLSAAELVDSILAAKRPGSIVPIRLGVPSGGRDDYLFGKLDVLVDSLLRSGYALVPVSVLIDHAR